jgi:hypothetical protein
MAGGYFPEKISHASWIPDYERRNTPIWLPGRETLADFSLSSPFFAQFWGNDGLTGCDSPGIFWEGILRENDRFRNGSGVDRRDYRSDPGRLGIRFSGKLSVYMADLFRSHRSGRPSGLAGKALDFPSHRAGGRTSSPAFYGDIMMGRPRNLPVPVCLGLGGLYDPWWKLRVRFWEERRDYEWAWPIR